LRYVDYGVISSKQLIQELLGRKSGKTTLYSCCNERFEENKELDLMSGGEDG